MTAAHAKKTDLSDIHQFVGSKIKELRGTMPVGDFAAKSGIHQALLVKLEGGEPSCLARLEFLAAKNGVKVSYFFPGGKIPKDYPEH